jgi:hypothetical protein
VTCLEVRELLPEFAVGVLSDRDRVEVERHLQWCAGCRKEAGELGHAAATFAFALPQAPVPQGLADRVVGRVKMAAGAPGSPRRVRTAAAVALAGLVAVAGLGWGVAMAGRAERFEDRAAQAERQQALALERFRKVLSGAVPGAQLPAQETFLGQLAPTQAGVHGGGAVLQLVSPTRLDFVIVIVNGLDPTDSEALPLQVTLANAGGEVLKAGQITELDADGGAELFHQFDHRDLSGFTEVRVTDARGAVALAGGVDQTPATPTP